MRGLACAALVALPLASLAQSLPPYVFSGPLLPLLVQMPANTWMRANANLYSDVWTSPDLEPLIDCCSPALPLKIIAAWSSFAWDSNRGDLVLWGGGHANYAGNDLYRWHASTFLWERGSLPSEVITDPLLGQIAIDGVDNAPISSHTYKNQQFLPLADRFITFGGAAWDNGGPFIRPLESAPTTQTRLTGPYLFDPSLADGNKVGGTTGSNVQRVTGTPITGGHMWQNRDIHRWLAGNPLPGTHVNGCTSYANEGGHDVVYIASAPRFSTTLQLFRYQLTTVADPTQDTITQVGGYLVGVSGQTTCGYDPVHRLFVKTGNNSVPFQFWDLSRTVGATNYDQNVAINASIAALQTWMSAQGVNIQNCGFEYDPTRVKFELWCGAADIWELTPPASGNTTTGWTVAQKPTPPQPAPPGDIGTGVMGKWRYAPYYDVFIGLEDFNEGQVWIYKPSAWVQPNPVGNALPTVAITSPAPNTTVSPQTTVTLTANATDSDGTISRVEWYVNGVKIGQATSAPYALAYAPIPVGAYSVVALAVDNAGGMTASAPVVFDVTATLNTVVLQRGLSGYNGVSDTWLDAFNPTAVHGADNPLWLDMSLYRPLVRFAIFQSEGGPVPDNAIVQSATLSLYKQFYDNTYVANALLKRWVESQATWNESVTGTSWTSAGAAAPGSDYIATPDAAIAGDFNPGWIDFDVTTRVRQWSTNATANFGWRISQELNDSAEKQFDSSEYTADATLRPKLTLVYSVSANPPTGRAKKSDFNGDGRSDILFENGTSRWFDYMNGVALQSGTPAPAAAPGWVVTGLGDFNGDGHVDILWTNAASPNQTWIYLLNGNTVIGSGALTVAPGYAPTFIADFDGDGHADIVFENAAGSRWLYSMNGTTVASIAPLPGAASGWKLVGVGDFNGDGKADLLWQNTNAPTQYWVYLMNGASIVGSGGFAVSAGYAVTKLGDFNGDGNTDLLIENGPSRFFYYMNGASVTASVPAPTGAPGWVVVGTADYNGDGKADLLWQDSGAPTQYWIYLLDGTLIIGSGGLGVSPGYVANVPN